MKNINVKMSLGEIVSALPSAGRYFNQQKIDYCCGGQRTLAQAAEEKNVSPEVLVLDLQQLAAEDEAKAVTRPSQMGSGQLADYIEARHHSFMREKLPLISEILDAVMRAHGLNHPELFELHRLYSQLRGELEQHLVKEEIRLFPGYQPATGQQSASSAAAVQAVIQELRQEHEAAGEILRQLRRITDDYRLPEDACPTYDQLFKNLEALETDLFEHIHLENNILFARETST